MCPLPFISDSCYFFLERRFYSGLSTLMPFKWTIVHILHWSQGPDFIISLLWDCPSFIQVPEAFTVKLIHPFSSNLGCRASYFPCLIAPAVSLLSSSLTTFSSFFMTRSQFCLHWKNTLGLPDDMDDLPLELLLSHWLSASHVTKIQYCTWAYRVCKEIRNFFSSKVFYFKPSRQSQIAHNTHDKLTASVTLLSECPPASLISHLLTLWYCCVYDWWTTVTCKSIFIF